MNATSDLLNQTQTTARQKSCMYLPVIPTSKSVIKSIMNLTQFQMKVLTIVPMTSASGSFVASTTIIVTIFRSRKKLKDAYRRLIFGMSVCDVLSSFAFILRPFKMIPTSAPGSTWLAIGNQASCDALTYIQLIGIVGAPMYNVGLSIYYFYLIKRNMREREFRKSIEPYLHGVPIVWTVVGATYGLVANMYNPGEVSECFIAEKPQGCDKDDTVECERGENASTFAVIYLGFPILVCLFAALGALLRTYWTIRSQELLMNKYRIDMVSHNLSMRVSRTNEGGGKIRRSLSWVCSLLRVGKKGGENDDDDDEEGQNNADRSNHPVGSSGGPGSVLAEALAKRRKPKKKRSRGQEFLVLSAKYVTGFTLTYFMTLVVSFMRVGGREPPFWLQLLDRGLQPLQGIFNILVYTSPHVKSMQSANPELSWFQAFFRVVMNGGDDDQGDEERRRSSKLRRKNSATSSTHLHRRNSAMSESSFRSIHGQKRNRSVNALTGGDVGTTSADESGVPGSAGKEGTGNENSDLLPKKSGSRRRQSFIKNSNRGDHNLFDLDEKKYMSKIEKEQKGDTFIMVGAGDEEENRDRRRVSFALCDEHNLLSPSTSDSHEEVEKETGS